MNRTLLKSKIHRAMVTDADLQYEGSVSIGKELCAKADLIEYERVEIYNITNGERFSTYVIFGREREICLNGAAARKVHRGDLVIIASFSDYTESECNNHKPKNILLDSNNNVVKDKDVK